LCGLVKLDCTIRLILGMTLPQRDKFCDKKINMKLYQYNNHYGHINDKIYTWIPKKLSKQDHLYKPHYGQFTRLISESFGIIKRNN